MDFASSHVLIASSNGVTEATPNAIALGFEHLQQDSQFETGDPILCSKCSAILSSSSIIKRNGNATTWDCEFCGNHNQMELNNEEIPKSSTQSFLIKKAQVENNSNSNSKSSEQHSDDDSNVIFCIDISGSMGNTTRVEGHFELKGKPSPKKNKENFTWVSRLEFVQAAVDTQLELMPKTAPHKKVGLVTFNNSVTIYGDGTMKPVQLEGETLSNYDSLLEVASSCALTKTISETRENLRKTVVNLSETGTTALGPALVASVSMASTKPGSKVIICTDGLANVGVGNLENQDFDFYERIARYAAKKGVVISVISIKGVDTKLEYLGKLADISSGKVDLVDSETLNFTDFLTSSFIATNCSIKLYSHSLFQFRNEQTIPNMPYIANRQIGNVTSDSDLAFEFHLQNKEAKDKFSKDQKISFQVQIDYTKLNGDECKKVITVMRPVTFDKQQAESTINIRVVSLSLAQQSARLAQNGNYEDAILKATNVKSLVEKQTHVPEFQQLYNIFMNEYSEITGELHQAMSQEASGGLGTSSYDRSQQRSDYAAKKLYNYKSSKAQACCIQ